MRDLKIRFIVLFFGVLFLSGSGLTAAEPTQNPTIPTLYPSQTGIGLITGHFNCFNPNNKETFDFPYYGIGFSFVPIRDLVITPRWFGSDCITTFSSSDAAYQHYFFGFGADVRYLFWKYFYINCSLDMISYNVKPNTAHSQPVLINFAVRNGWGAVGSAGLGMNILLADHYYLYAGTYTSAGQVGTTRKEKIDEVFDFTTPLNYTFGLTWFF